MCLAVPGRVIELYENSGMHMAKVDFGGVVREVCVEAIPGIKINEFVIVHAGFALSALDEEEALETLKLIKEMDQFDADEKRAVSKT
jgi:hydrogenase expression/formation protein HypC